MLFLTKLLGAPISLPLAGMKFVFQQLADVADQELNDESVVREQLLLLQVQLEEGDIDEDEYGVREAELLARMREIKARQRAAAADATADAEVSPESNVGARRRMVIETPFDE
ncbi:MAG TPA: gas vesicle protein GvpG [Chloroflexota bacterium]|nr:gas vesicle protein GvpG [Chloroflexota bacterium]